MRQARAEGAGSADVTVEDYGGLDGLESELAAINGEFRARIATARSQHAPIEVIRAIRNERIIAVRMVRERWQKKVQRDTNSRLLANLHQRNFRAILSLRRTLE